MPIDVADVGGLEPALRHWKREAAENSSAIRRHRYFTGPSETRKIKARLALKRKRRARGRSAGKRSDWWAERRLSDVAEAA